MSLLRKKSWWQQIVRSPIAIIFLLGLSIMFAFAVHDRYVVERDMADRRAKSEAELERETDRRSELEKKVEKLNSEQGIESEIRKNFDVAREGETVVVLVEEDRSMIEPLPLSSQKLPIWRRFLNFIIPW
ncbi:hypothetical protein A2837_00440 [Candidatus Kaiserbacteria bacterium RIFCSPHIGHO2_01_FULL_46_22]|uniref:Septum formation initiator n=1 Tax=Candidatus Kaiserbacteria bacterium RIFCSPHIGHO2_01_FULL_46_22 TaxID=1798475 RepID=A0A1F6BXD7_9BACT|nr:MAG: hypothetical protein A2837_00440 [Candidatus Kaiserbacteria bacterium RIFCSPHIGHO2_01_FULL_46_22]